jgi:hypothetical protein
MPPTGSLLGGIGKAEDAAAVMYRVGGWCAGCRGWDSGREQWRAAGGSLAWVSGQVGPRGGGRCKISLAQRQLAARPFHIRLLAQAVGLRDLAS